MTGAHPRGGYYARRLLSAAAHPHGVRAELELIGFADAGNDLRPVIVSEEPLARQLSATGVPNRPSEAIAAGVLENSRRVLLDVHILAPRIVRIRMGGPEDVAARRNFGMLAPGALEALAGEAPAPELHHLDDAVVVDAGEVFIRLSRDPFALGIECATVPGAAVETSLQDRDVHGFLVTPPPGTLTRPDGACALWSWALTPDERLYGLGEVFGPLDHRGRRFRLWNIDAWGTTKAAAYKYVPFLQSSRGYGIFAHTPAEVRADLGATSLRTGVLEIDEAALDLFVVFGGSPAEILAEYTRLTGRPVIPPRWAFGVWLSRCRYQSREEVADVARRVRAESIPCDVLHIDPAWLARPNLNCDFISNEDAFPDLPSFVRELDAQGFKVSLWELPYVSAASPRFAEAAARGYFLRDATGAPIPADFGGPAPDGIPRAIVDFTNPEARRWWQALHRPWLRAGVAVFKTDFGEGVPADAHAGNGMTGRQLHNLYPLLYNAAVSEVIGEETGRPGFVWGRSGWAGLQRYPGHWGGDPKTDVWSMAAELRGGLNLALSAPGIWSHDIGGFYGPPPSPALYIRWTQMGMFSPLTRAHGTTPREPWAFGAQAVEVFRRYARLRVRLAPYLYTTAWEAVESGLPMLRPLVLEAPDDPGAAAIDDSFMLGGSLLVAPVFSESVEPVARRLYLPAGGWCDFWSDERLTGGRWITRTAPLDLIPVYVRAGTILPLGPEAERVGEQAPTQLTLEVYPGASGATRIYWDGEAPPTRLTLAAEGGGWRLRIEGEREADWIVRWHLPQGVRTVPLGRLSAGETRVDGA